MKRIALVLAAFLVAAPVFAAPVDGKWSGSLETPNGAFEIGFTFKADGATLTGSMLGMDGMEIPIQNGQVDGDSISFGVMLDFGGMPFELLYKGKVAASEIAMMGEAGGMPFEFVVKKSE
jgi:hydrogenase/urease accessory protein HupE